MFFRKMSMAGTLVAAALVAAGCGQIEFGIETQSPLAETADPDKTPVDNVGVTVKEPEATETVEPDPAIAAYWSEAIDDRTGIRFAVPCFWEVQIPTLDPTGLGAFYVRNYDEAFVLAQPRGIVWDAGGIKIDFIYVQGTTSGLPLGAALSDVAATLTDGTTGILSAEQVVINGQEALRFASQGMFDETPRQSYLFRLGEDLYLLFGAMPAEAILGTDVQAVLNSIALTNEVSVQIPDVFPSPAPEGVSAPCLKDLYPSSDAEPLFGELPCTAAVEGTAEAFACQIQDALLARDMEMVRSLMRDPFAIGYWQSEGVSKSPAVASDELDRYRLPADTSGLTLTTDRSQFPPLFGMPPEAMFGPDIDVVLVIYSEGWGQDGLGATLLYVVQEGSGSYSWYGMVIAHAHFDK